MKRRRHTLMLVFVTSCCVAKPLTTIGAGKLVMKSNLCSYIIMHCKIEQATSRNMNIYNIYLISSFV